MAVSLRWALIFSVLLLQGCFKLELPFFPSDQEASSPQLSGTYYKVRQGDTLYNIARRIGVDYKTLARRNGIRYPYTIYVGQRINLTASNQAKASPTPRVPAKTTRPVTPSKSKRPVEKNTTKAAVGGGLVKLQWPVKGVVTSHFGRRGSRMHDGIDIGAKSGTPVYAAAAGKVIYSDNKLSGFGNLIIIKHSSDFVTIYAHNNKNFARKNQQVKKGEKIATVGQTGRATGPHLHFEVRRGQAPSQVRAVDPMAYLP